MNKPKRDTLCLKRQLWHQGCQFDPFISPLNDFFIFLVLNVLHIGAIPVLYNYKTFKYYKTFAWNTQEIIKFWQNNNSI